MGLARYMTGKCLGRGSRRMAILGVPIDKPPKQVYMQTILYSLSTNKDARHRLNQKYCNTVK